MRTIPVQELSYEKFRKYGDYIKMLDDDSYRTNAAPGRTNEFYPDQMQFFFNTDTPVSACVCCVSKEPELSKVAFAEFHGKTCEGVMPLDADCVIFVAPAGRGLNPDQIEAFHVPKGTFVRLNVGVIHGRQFTYNTDLVHVLVMLPQRTYANDNTGIRIEEDDQVIVDIK